MLFQQHIANFINKKYVKWNDNRKKNYEWTDKIILIAKLQTFMLKTNYMTTKMEKPDHDYNMHTFSYTHKKRVCS